MFEKFIGVSRLLFLLLLLYITISQLKGTDVYFLHNIDLIFHEAGHTLFIFLGQFMSVLGGTLTQLTIPIIFGIYFYSKRELFSFYIMLWWLGENLYDVSIYLGDARAQVLPLLADGLTHDWNFMLQKLNILQFDSIISRFIWLGAVILMILSIILAARYAIKNFTKKTETRLI